MTPIAAAQIAAYRGATCPKATVTPMGVMQVELTTLMR